MAKKKKMNLGGFSVKRATGISAAKSKIARATGVPTTKAGRKRKVQRTVSKAATGGCLTLVIEAIAVVAVIALVIALCV